MVPLYYDHFIIRYSSPCALNSHVFNDTIGRKEQALTIGVALFNLISLAFYCLCLARHPPPSPPPIPLGVLDRHLS